MSLKSRDEKGYLNFSDVEISKGFFNENQEEEELSMISDYEIPDDFFDNPKQDKKGLLAFITGNRLEDNLIILAIMGGVTFSVITWIQGKLK
jgi:hypothetical protein